jgi:TRAP-type C4-dicarboxylate transport system permease small subunit
VLNYDPSFASFISFTSLIFSEANAASAASEAKYMLETSKDVLNLVIAFCVLWFTIFLCWMLFYVVMMMKNAYQMIKQIQEKIKRIDALIETIKARVEKSVSSLAMVAQGIKQAIIFMENRWQKHEEKKQKKSKGK